MKNRDVVPKKSLRKGETLLDGLTITLALANDVANVLEVAPFIGRAASLLKKIQKANDELGRTDEKRNILEAHLTNLTRDICAAVLRMQATGHSGLISRLTVDLEKYGALITTASRFIEAYDKQWKVARVARRNKLDNKMDKLDQELNAFGARFKNNRLVDTAIHVSENARVLHEIDDTVTNDKLEKWLLSPPDMKRKQRETERLRKEGPDSGFLKATSSSNGRITWDHYGLKRVLGRVCSGGLPDISLHFTPDRFDSSAAVSKLFNDKKLCGDMRSSPPPPAVAFFYFDFRTKESQGVECALRHFILQLSSQSPHPYKALNEYYMLSNGQTLPSYEDLAKILHRLLRELGRTYVVLDALNECAADDVQTLVDLVSVLRAWTDTPLHLLITTRRLLDSKASPE
ncbi:hypothetical protein B0H19DRAFT_1247099 [Mycena capillaripes]|nr:hypothetical protein B0H19DRAFT_1247099 [Mycena capillaripes]